MGIRNQKPGHQTTESGTDRQRVGRDYVEEVQRRAARLNEAIEKKTENYSGDDFAEHQQQQIQQHMARLRSEAVQARRLAEQIQNLSQDGTARKRKPVMNDTPLVDAGHARRASDKRRASGSQSSFNPLHPSMELPPEQLIRLLGLEGKKTRKRPKSATAKKVMPAKEVTPPNEVAPKAASASAWTLPDDMVPASRKRATHSVNTASNPARSKRRRSYADEPLFQERRKGLLLPAIAIGALAGIAASAYLFWWQPAPEQPTITTPAVAVKPPAAAKTVPPRQPAATVAPSPGQAINAPIQRKQPEVVNDAKWRAAVQAQEQRVRAAAEERLRERMQAAQYRAAEATSAAAPAIPQETIDSVPTPSQTIDVPPEGLDPGVAAMEMPPEPEKQQASTATPDEPPAAPVEVSTHTEIEMPLPPEPASEAPAQEPAALQPSIDTHDTSGVPEALETAPAAENSLAQPREAHELPADVVGNDLEPQPDKNEPVYPEASF
jgi:hypothetical protein